MEGAAASARDRAPAVLMHVGELIKFRDERKTLRLTLVSGEVVEGVVRWFDDETIHLATVSRDEITLFKHAVSYYSVAGPAIPAA